MEEAARMKAMFFAPAETGHMLPLIRVAEAVARAGLEVIVCTSDFDAEKWRAKVEKFGRFKSIECGGNWTPKTWEEHLMACGKVPFVPLHELWQEPVRRLMEAEHPRPNVIVADFTSTAAQDAAHELGITLVMNFPCPLDIVSGGLALPDPGATFQRGGITLGRSRLRTLDIAKTFDIAGMGGFADKVIRHMKHSLLLIHNFFGLEQPRLLPPNVKMVGAVLPPSQDLARALKDESAELDAWLRQPGAPPTILISTGTLVYLKEWQVRVFFAAVKQAKLRAVWSLREPQQAFLPSKDDPDFWISAWVPQAALMQNEAIRLVVTHCGWGGTLECISSAQPALCVPFFADQFTNAGLLVKTGCGEFIYTKQPKEEYKPVNNYKEGAFTPESMAALLGKILADPSYKKNVSRLQRLSLAAGGAAEAARQVEAAARFGADHLVAGDLQGTLGGNILHSMLACFLVALGGITYCASKPAGTACLGGIAVLGLFSEWKRAK